MGVLRVVTLCSGYDSQCLALERLRRCYPGRFDYELVAWAEVDRYAIEAHDVLFPQYADRNMGDITACDWSKITSSVDLLTYSTPCQSISFAGKRDGLKEGSGTASSIIWSVLRAIDALRPRYLLMENVKALVSSRFVGDFRRWESELARRGYESYAAVLNAEDYGVPQHRERVFMVSVRGAGAGAPWFHFPAPCPSGRCLADVLEHDVPGRHYLTERTLAGYLRHNERMERLGNGFRFAPRDVGLPALTVTTKEGSRFSDNYIAVGCAVRGRGEGHRQTLELGSPGVSNALTTVPKSSMVFCVSPPLCDREFHGRPSETVSHTLKANEAKKPSLCWELGGGEVRIRRLTPREIFRLMDVDEADIDRLLGSGLSDSQLRKMGGNSIVVGVLYHIFRKMFVETGPEGSERGLF